MKIQPKLKLRKTITINFAIHSKILNSSMLQPLGISSLFKISGFFQLSAFYNLFKPCGLTMDNILLLFFIPIKVIIDDKITTTILNLKEVGCLILNKLIQGDRGDQLRTEREFYHCFFLDHFIKKWDLLWHPIPML